MGDRTTETQKADVYLRPMDVLTRLRLLVGPVRPFALGKLLFALKRRRAYAELHRNARIGSTYSPLASAPSLRSGLYPLPGEAWWSDHRGELSTWLQSIADHRIQVADSVFGVRRAGTEWRAEDVREETFDDMRTRIAMLDADYVPMDWNAHPAAGVRWPELQWFARAQQVEHVEDSSVAPDIRIPHELSRMHHWMSLSLDPAYHRLLRNQIIEVLAHNPPGYGLQWAFPMGVSMRLFCMLAALDWMRQLGTHDEALEKLVAASAVDHARFLMSTAEWSGGMRTSHYIGCLFGLLAAGVYVDSPESVTWLRKGLTGLEEELSVQFLSDGMNFEASTTYHKHVIDFYVQATTLLISAHSLHPHIVQAPSQTWLQRVHKAVGALQTLERVGMPIIGDNDDGMAVKLLGYHAQRVFVQDAIASKPRRQSSPGIRHSAFADFGFDVYEHEQFTLTARCGPVGQWGKGGHSHNDRNAITLRVGDTWLIIDSGCMTYTGNAARRNADRSTAAHATLCLMGREQLAWPTDNGEGLFWMMPDHTGSNVLERTSTKWVGVHRGYGKPHKRTIEIGADGISCVDDYQPTRAEEQITIRFPLAPDVTFANNTFFHKGAPLATLAVEGASRITAEPTAMAPAYGVSVPNITVVVAVSGRRCVWSIKVIGSFVAYEGTVAPG